MACLVDVWPLEGRVKVHRPPAVAAGLERQAKGVCHLQQQQKKKQGLQSWCVLHHGGILQYILRFHALYSYIHCIHLLTMTV